MYPSLRPANKMFSFVLRYTSASMVNRLCNESAGGFDDSACPAPFCSRSSLLSLSSSYSCPKPSSHLATLALLVPQPPHLMLIFVLILATRQRCIRREEGGVWADPPPPSSDGCLDGVY